MNMAETRRFRLTAGGQKLAPPLERASQMAVFHWARKCEGLWPALRLLHSVPNEGQRSYATANMLKAMGLKTGYPDISLPVARGGYIGLAIEMKRPGEEPSDVQLAWLSALETERWLAIVCYGAKDAIAALEAYVTARPTIIGPARIVRE